MKEPMEPIDDIALCIEENAKAEKERMIANIYDAVSNQNLSKLQKLLTLAEQTNPDWDRRTSRYGPYQYALTSEVLERYGNATPLAKACATGNLGIVVALLEAKAIVDPYDYGYHTKVDCSPLAEACKGNFTEIALMLLEAEADPEIWNKHPRDDR